MNLDNEGCKYEFNFFQNSPNKRFYFQHLIYERLFYQLYSSQRKQEIIYKEQARRVSLIQDQLKSNILKNIGLQYKEDDSKSYGDYFIQPFLKSYISLDRMKRIDLDLIPVNEERQFMRS